MKLPVPLMLACVFAAVSCKEPLVKETFVKSGQRDSDAYVYELDMSDTLAVYSLSFFTRIDCPEGRFSELPEICLEVSLESPAGRAYEEKVYVPKSAFTDTEHFARDCIVQYRKGFRPAEYGLWRMSVTVDNEDVVRGLRGLGVRMEKDR